MMAGRTRLEEYRICQERGHQPSNNFVNDYMICRFCWTYYKTVTTTKLVEAMKPEGADDTNS